MFLRGGDEWTMEIPLDFGGSDVSAVQLSLRNNAATRGDAQGTVPVIAFSGTVSGAQTLTVTLKEPGQVCIGLYGEVGGQPTLFAMEWWIVP